MSETRKAGIARVQTTLLRLLVRRIKERNWTGARIALRLLEALVEEVGG